MNKQTGLLLSILGVISMVLVVLGVTYAFFIYTKEGTTENSITTGSITFIYEEVDKQGAGISIENAYPISSEIGKIQSDSKEVFNFTVKSQTLNETEIPYTITARKKADSTLDEDAVKLYLTEVSGETETPLTESIYHHLTDYTKAPAGVSEKVLYTDVVPDGSRNYIKNYRLRMWIPSEIDFSPVEDGEGNVTYPYNNKTFTVTVNVYANAKVVTVPEQSTAIIPTHFAYGSFGSSDEFFTAATTDYTTLGYSVFNGLGADGLISTCINDGELFCLRANIENEKLLDYQEHVALMNEHFGESNCSDTGSDVYECTSADGRFYCDYEYGGYISCKDNSENIRCISDRDGNLECFDMVSEPDEPVAFVPTYFEYGTPTTASTTDYTTLEKTVFITLGLDGSIGSCINNNGLFCIKANDFENSVVNLKSYFGEDNCSVSDSNLNCAIGSLACYADVDGNVNCFDHNFYSTCYANADGSSLCEP